MKTKQYFYIVIKTSTNNIKNTVMKATYFISEKQVSKSTYYAKRNWFRNRYFINENGVKHISNERA